jgi:putative ABC transport system permease protein
MFFVAYLRRELSRRARQAIVIALGLAVGVGLVVTVSAASAGVAGAESGVLGALYGVGTDVTVTVTGGRGRGRGRGWRPAGRGIRQLADRRAAARPRAGPGRLKGRRHHDLPQRAPRPVARRSPT